MTCRTSPYQAATYLGSLCEVGHCDGNAGGFNRFFEDLSSLNWGLAAPDLFRTEQLAGGLSAALCSSLL
jgi:hypothetical protein